LVFITLDNLRDNDNTIDVCKLAKKIKPRLAITDWYIKQIISDQLFTIDPIYVSYKIYRLTGSKNKSNKSLFSAAICALSYDWQQNAINQTGILHQDTDCLISSMIVAYICNCFLNNKNPKLIKIKKLLNQSKQFDQIWPIVNLQNIELHSIDFTKPHVYKSLACGLYVLKCIKNKTFDWIYTFRYLIDLEGDISVNCIIAGQIAGSYYGLSGIPIEYIRNLDMCKITTRIASYLDTFGL